MSFLSATRSIIVPLPPFIPLQDESEATGERGIADWRMISSAIPRGPPAEAEAAIAQFALRGRRGLGGRPTCLLGGSEGGAEAEAEAVPISLR